MTTDHLVAPVELKFAPDGPPGEFVGYASVFNVRDSHQDVVEPGAFSASLAEHRARGTMPGFYIEHSAHVGGDPLPAGEWLDLREDGRGLKGRGRIVPAESAFGERVIGLMRAGVMKGLSIAYRV